MTTFKELWDNIDWPALMAEKKKQLDKDISSLTSEERKRMEALVGKIVMAKTLKERHEITEREYSKIGRGGSTKVLFCANDFAWEIRGLTSYPDYEGHTQKQTLPPVVLQGSFSPQKGGLHTPTLEEIMANANRRDPTQPYFDTNSDHMAQIDPLAPHWSGGEYSTFVNPLKPGPKMPNNG